MHHTSIKAMFVLNLGDISVIILYMHVNRYYYYSNGLQKAIKVHTVKPYYTACVLYEDACIALELWNMQYSICNQNFTLAS